MNLFIPYLLLVYQSVTNPLINQLLPYLSTCLAIGLSITMLWLFCVYSLLNWLFFIICPLIWDETQFQWAPLWDPALMNDQLLPASSQPQQMAASQPAAVGQRPAATAAASCPNTPAASLFLFPPCHPSVPWTKTAAAAAAFLATSSFVPSAACTISHISPPCYLGKRKRNSWYSAVYLLEQ